MLKKALLLKGIVSYIFYIILGFFYDSESSFSIIAPAHAPQPCPSTALAHAPQPCHALPMPLKLAPILPLPMLLNLAPILPLPLNLD